LQAKKTEVLQSFSVRLRAAISRRGVTLAAVAAECAVSVSTVGAWTQGKNWPKVEQQPKLAAFLKTSVMHLVHGVAEEAEVSAANTEHPYLEPIVAEAAPPLAYDLSPRAPLAQQLIADFSALVAAAGDNRDRLGWVRVQLDQMRAVSGAWMDRNERNRAVVARHMQESAEHKASLDRADDTRRSRKAV
jgi:transcriptional regulator with XRE-family HTH domain